MLTVSGNCLSCHANKKEGTSSKTGKPYSFTTHRCCIHHPESGMDPVYVETGEFPLIPGKAYTIKARVRAYVVGEGGNAQANYSLMTYKDHPPQEIASPQAIPAKQA
jgi:hypothetical protein